MAKDFDAGAKELAALVGDGDLVGTFAVDGGERTVPLEAGFFRNHMGRNGRVEIRNWSQGGPHAAQNSLENTHRESLEEIAGATLRTGPAAAMKGHLERQQREFERRAPRVTGSYQDSTMRVVTDDGDPVSIEVGESYGEGPK